MFFEKDYIMRMIDDMSRFIALTVLGRSDSYVSLEDEMQKAICSDLPERMLYTRCKGLADEGRINDAEDELFDGLDTENTAYLDIGLAFFHYINGFTDERLEECDYSREEVAMGIKALGGEYGVQLGEAFRIPGED